MEETFDDYKYKNTSKKVRFTLRQKEEKILSPWQISNFVNNFNTYYYKTEVIETIIIALKKGIAPENIIVLDESFKIDRQYKKISYISTTDEDLKSLYHMGNPISLYPNDKIILMHMLFKYFRKINESLKIIFKAKKLDVASLHIYYKSYLDKKFDDMLNLIRLDIKECLKESSEEQSQRDTIEKVLIEFEKSFQDYLKNKKNLENIKELLSKNDLTNIDFKDKEFVKYFKSFYKYISHIQRPVVAVYNSNNILTILCRAHINKNEANAVTMNLKSITHNSPVAGIFEAGATVIKAINDEDRAKQLHELQLKQEDLKVEQEKIKLELMKKDLDQKELQYKNQEIEHQIKKMEFVEKKMKFLSMINEIEESAKVDGSKPNPYLENQIQELRNNINTKNKNLLRRNNFELDYENSHIIDVEELYA